MEIWKPICEGSEYKVSNYGNARRDRKPSTKSRNRRTWPDSYPLKLNKTIAGYYQFQAHQKVYSIHRVVAMLFIPNPENKIQVNHKDGNKLNNKADNLEWATSKENLDHAVRIGAIKTKGQSTSSKLVINLRTGIYYDSIIEAAESVNMTAKNLSFQLGGYVKNKRDFRIA